MSEQRWNSSLHAFEILLGAVPPGAGSGIDVGCGEGETARRLRRRVPEVIGLDCDAASIDLARGHDDDITYVLGDLLSAELPSGTFDVVTAVNVVHHVDQRRGLERLSGLLRPGGVLLVVGLAKSRSVGDYARDAVDSVALRRHSIRKGVWETPAPKIWPPPMTYAESETAALDTLPGARFRRIPYFRYALTWTRPVD